VIVCAEEIPEATALYLFAPVMIFVKSKNSDKRQISATCLVNEEIVHIKFEKLTFPVSGLTGHL